MPPTLARPLVFFFYVLDDSVFPVMYELRYKYKYQMTHFSKSSVKPGTNLGQDEMATVRASHAVSEAVRINPRPIGCSFSSAAGVCWKHKMKCHSLAAQSRSKYPGCDFATTIHS